MVKVGSELILLVVIGLYSFYTFPTGFMTITLVVAGVAFIITKSLKAVLGVFIGAVGVRLLNNVLQPSTQSNRTILNGVSPSPTPKEGFQAKDPISIHQRIATNKKTVAPVTEITGVLESPAILDSLQLSEIHPKNQGAATRTLPAALKARDTIRTPSEGSVISETSIPTLPNPYLQNGPDNTGILTALVQKGTALFAGHPAAEVPATKLGPATAT